MSYEENIKLYVGNLNYKTGDEDLCTVFRDYGTVTDCTVVMDRETGRSRGFAFVTFETQAEAQNAMDKLDGFELAGRPLKVNMARQRQDGGGGRGRSGGYGDRGDRGGYRGGYSSGYSSGGGGGGGGYSRGYGGYN